MEIFVFPDLMYSLVLANIMSPRIWKWLEEPWFKDIEKAQPYKRIQRLRQYIMDNYSFNLDLDTWGLTTKQEQLDRFSNFIDLEVLKNSNALFGYEGDKYYFDMDIRRHFGLDKYTSDTIPYWKTETVEAMDAFRYKEGYPTGAGECVSLAGLWAAALFIVCKIPLEDIFLMATPLHSQNFVIARDGILTNNRRIVTRNMWVNGTELSEKARRALENEQVTVVAHITGHVHVMYPDSSIDQEQFRRFSDHLHDFLSFDLTPEIFCNFLRAKSPLQKCFQFEHFCHGKSCYIAMEKVFAYEHTSSYSIIGPSRSKLLDEIDSEEFDSSPLPARILLNRAEQFLEKNRVSPSNNEDLVKFKQFIDGNCLHMATVIENIRNFCLTVPRLPDLDAKQSTRYGEDLTITTEMSREEIIRYLDSMRKVNPLADYSFYAYRDLNRTDAVPFLKAALERSPVSINGFKELPITGIIDQIDQYPEESIYDEAGRLAQPDEVFNYRRGEGAEKALLLANILRSRSRDPVTITIEKDTVTLVTPTVRKTYKTAKQLHSVSWEL